MPNHVKHRLVITGLRERVLEFANRYFTEYDYTDQNGVATKHLRFDFEKVAPIPEGFDTSLPSPMDSTFVALFASRADCVEWRKEALLDGETASVVTKYRDDFEARRKDVLEWRAANPEAEERHFFLAHYEHFETPEQVADAYIRNIELSGHATWYELQRARWGTKWNAYDNNIVIHDDGQTASIDLYFETAWDTPRPIWERLGAQGWFINDSCVLDGFIDEEGGFFYLVIEKNVWHEAKGTREGGPYDYPDEDEGEDEDEDEPAAITHDPT